MLLDDEEHLVAVDFLETVINNPSRLADECLAVFESSTLKFKKEWFAQLLKDPASFNPTTVALSFLSNENQDRLERVCSEDTADVFVEFCKTAASKGHRSDHALTRHLMDCVVISSEQRGTQRSRRNRVREWLMPILEPVEFEDLFQPLCRLLNLPESYKDSKKRTVRMLVLKLVSLAVNRLE